MVLDFTESLKMLNKIKRKVIKKTVPELENDNLLGVQLLGHPDLKKIKKIIKD